MKYAQRGLTTGRLQKNIPNPASSLEPGSELSQEPGGARQRKEYREFREKSGGKSLGGLREESALSQGCKRQLTSVF